MEFLNYAFYEVFNNTHNLVWFDTFFTDNLSNGIYIQKTVLNRWLRSSLLNTSLDCFYIPHLPLTSKENSPTV